MVAVWGTPLFKRTGYLSDVSIDDSGSEPAYPFMCPILQPLFVVRCKGLPPQFPRNKDFSEGMLMQPVRGVALPHSTASLIFVLVGAFFVAPTIIKATLYFLQRFRHGEVALRLHSTAC